MQKSHCFFLVLWSCLYTVTDVSVLLFGSRAESLPSLERATKYNPMYESEATTGYSHYYRRYPEPPVYSSASAEASTDFSSEEIRHIYENSELTKEVCVALS